MKITYLAHSCFEIEGSNGVKILTDPYESGGFGGAVKYKKPDRKVDIVLISHDHSDHNWTKGLPGNPEIIKMKSSVVKGINIEAIDAFHDTSAGRERGKMVLFKFAIDGITLCHLGDLGHLLTKEQIGLLNGIDMLFIPVGGKFTIDSDQANMVINQIEPNVIIPMHYKTQKIDFQIRPVDEFLSKRKKVDKKNSSIWETTKETLPEHGTTVVLNPLC